jgi:anthranilate 1,2-dioxygenase (deaminating, decarboxylating) large subunit
MEDLKAKESGCAFDKQKAYCLRILCPHDSPQSPRRNGQNPSNGDTIMKHTPRLVLLSSLLAALAWLPSGQAYDLPPVNLGFTSFLDGGPPAGPGFYFQQYLMFYTSDRFTDQNGHGLPFPDPDLNVWVSLSQFIYQSDQKVLLGSKWGMDVIVPVVGFNLDYSAPGPFPAANGAGVGDLLVGPYLQWDPIMGKNGPIFMHRIEMQLLLPTGRYDAQKELNPGSHFFSFNPYWSGTLFITPRLTSSLRFHYLWNDSNDEPNRGFVGIKETQAGQAIHFNYALEYELVPKQLRAGVNGYYLKQISDTKADGQKLPGRREQVFGIGPGAVWHISQNNHLFFNTYFETLAENRTEGVRFILRYVHHF